MVNVLFKTSHVSYSTGYIVVGIPIFFKSSSVTWFICESALCLRAQGLEKTSHCQEVILLLFKVLTLLPHVLSPKCLPLAFCDET